MSSFLRMLGPTILLILSCHVGSPSPNTSWSFRHSSNRSQNKNITPALCYNVYLHKLLPSLLACALSDYKQLWEHDYGPTATIMMRNHKVLPTTFFFRREKGRIHLSMNWKARHSINTYCTVRNCFLFPVFLKAMPWFLLHMYLEYVDRAAQSV